MSYVTSSQGRPIQGVSKQPEKTRLPGQCTRSDNMRPDVVRGLTDRVGTVLSATLPNAPTDPWTMWYYYDRGTTEEYFISIEVDGTVSAWSPDGTEHTVNVEDDAEASYLATALPKKNLNMITVGDYTFMVNKEVTVQPSSTLTDAIVNTGIVYVQFLDYTQQIKVYIDGALKATYTAPDGSTASMLAQVKTELVCARLVSALGGGSGSADGASWSGTSILADYTVERVKNTVVIERIDNADFELLVEDSADNKNSVGIKGRITSTNILPGSAPEGFLLEVDPPGAQTAKNSNFWLKAENTNSDHVTWRESIAPGISVGADPATMPHVLVRESVDEFGVATFTLRQGEWEDRKVGSDETNPQPTFVGKTITSVGLAQNRLFFTAGESVILGRTADFFNFYRETAQASLDTDPVDVFADVPQVNLLEHHIFFDRDVVFFSKNGQFIMDIRKPIKPSTAVLNQVTAFENITDVSPVPTGDAILFAFQYGRFTGVREFFTDSVTDTKKAKPVTDHVKSYVAGKPTIMKASTNLNVLLIKTDNDDSEIYAYDWLWQGPEKVQSAWGKLNVDNGNILHFEFSEELLWMVVERDGAVNIEKMDFGDPPDEYTGYTIRLDQQQNVTFTYDEPTQTWRTPDILPSVDLDTLVAVRTKDAYPEDIGTQIALDRDGAEITSDEDLGPGATVDAVMGTRYMRVYDPTNPVALDKNGLALNLDRLTVGAFYMNYNTTGDVKATVTKDSGGTIEKEFNNRILGDANNLVGFAPLIEGSHRMAIRQKSDRYSLSYTTNSHLPLEVRDFEYDGNLNRRGRRI